MSSFIIKVEIQTAGAVQSVGKVTSGLGDMEKAAKKAAQDMARNMRATAGEARKLASELARGHRETAGEARRAAQDMARNMRATAGEARKLASELKRTAQEAARETASEARKMAQEHKRAAQESARAHKEAARSIAASEREASRAAAVEARKMAQAHRQAAAEIKRAQKEVGTLGQAYGAHSAGGLKRPRQEAFQEAFGQSGQYKGKIRALGDEYAAMGKKIPVNEQAEFFRGLSHAMRIIAAIEVARGAVSVYTELADTYTMVSNRIRTVSDGQVEFTRNMEMVFDVANDVRMGVDDTAKAFQAMSGATANMGLATSEVWTLTTALAKSMTLSGASASEAASTMTQFGQALRKGKLDGDEFRSIMENNVVVQRLLATQMGVSTDQLISLAHAGLITRDVMVNALLSGAEEIDRQFAQTMPTLEQRWISFKNQMIEVVGKFNETAGVGTIVGAVFDTIAAKIAGVVELATAAAAAVGALGGVVRDLPGGDEALGALSYAKEKLDRYANPHGAAVAAYDAYNYIDQNRTGGGSADLTRGFTPKAQRATYEDNLARLVGKRKQPPEAAAANRARVSEGIGDVVNYGTRFAGILEDLVDPQGVTGDEKKRGGSRKKQDDFPERYKRMLGSIYPVIAAQQEMTEAQTVLDEAVKRGLISQERANAIYKQKAFVMRDSIDPIAAYKRGLEEEIELNRLRLEFDSDGAFQNEVAWREKLKDLQKGGLDLSKFEASEAKKKIELLQKEADATARVVAMKQQLEGERASVNGGLGIETAQQQADRAGIAGGNWNVNDYQSRIISQKERYERAVGMLDEGLSPADRANAIATLTAQYDQLAKSIKLGTEYQDGFTKGYREMLVTLGTDADATAKLFADSMGLMTESLSTFLETGKFDFSSFVDSILKMLADLAANRLMKEFLTLFSSGASAASSHEAGHADYGALVGSLGTLVANANARTAPASGSPDIRVVVTDPRGNQLDTMRSPQGQRVTLDHLRKNASYLRALQSN